METGANELNQSAERQVKYEVFQYDGNFNHWMLKISGSQSNCPHQSVNVFQHPDGRFITIKQPCTTECPLARFSKDPNGELHYEIACSPHLVIHDVTEETRQVLERVPTILKPM